MPLLYHYVLPEKNPYGPAEATGTAVVPSQLRTITLRACDPSTFNDPFEVRPCFGQQGHHYCAKSHESFYEKTLGIKHSLTRGALRFRAAYLRATVKAEKPDGFDKGKVNNGVLEPLREADLIQ